MPLKIADHWLTGTNSAGKTIKKDQTPNFYKPPFNTTTGLPDATIIHYTAMTSFSAAVKVLTTKYESGNASAHLVIGKAGEVTQLAPFNYRTWHAGESFYNGRKGYNSLSVGIEIDNAGWLKKFGDNDFSRKRLKSKGISFKKNQVFHGRHENPKVPYEYWEEYTDDQIEVVFEICKLLRETYGMIEFLGHDEIAPSRKQDPGPAFPMDELRGELLKDRSGEVQEGIVNTNLLNIRSGAGGQYEKVAQPLPQNAQVKVLEETDGWYKVRTEIEGWVSKKYITPTK